MMFSRSVSSVPLHPYHGALHLLVLFSFTHDVVLASYRG